MLQSLTLEILQPISSDLYDHYQSSVNHAGTGKTSKLRIKTKLHRTCQYSDIGIGIDQLKPLNMIINEV